MALEWAYKNDPEGLEETMRAFIESLTPSFIPTAAVPFIEWYADRSIFLDRPIVSRSKKDLEPVLQYSGRTSESVKLVAEIMDKIPGLKKVANPAKIENLIRGYTGGLGRIGLEQADWLLKTFGAVKMPPEPSMTLNDIPGIRGFTQRFPSANSRSIEKFYKRYETANREWESRKQRKGVRGYGITVGVPAKLKKDKSVAKALSVLRKTADIIYKSKRLNPVEKRERLDNIYIAMINLARASLGKEGIKTGKLIAPNKSKGIGQLKGETQ